MTGQSVKAKITNDIIVLMSVYLGKDMLQILQQVLVSEFVQVNMEEITTLPATWKNDTDQRNMYILQLFDCKKKIKNNTKYNYLHAVKRLITLINKPLDAMEETDISYYLSWYEKKNMIDGGKKNQASTVNNERRFLSAFFTWMRKEKLIADNPVEVTEPLKVVWKPIDYFKPDEIAKLRDACQDERERALFEVLRSTGARIGEIAEIELSQIDWPTGDVMIISEKSDRYRTLYLDDDARHYLKKYLSSRTDSSPYMFTKLRAPYGKMTTDGLRNVFKRIGDGAGVECRVYPHKMRKTLGMNLKNKGVDIGDIQEIMGHADPSTTVTFYAQSTPKTLRIVRERAA